MGISKVMGCVSAVLFSASYYLKHIGCTYTAIPLLFVASVGFTIAVASLPFINATSILGKSSNGNFPLWSKVLFGPYLVSVKLYVVLKRLKRKESLFDEVSEGLYVGGWPTSRSRLPLGDPALIDCTCELPRSYFVPTGAYLCIPLWDTRSPGPGDIESAVRWACKRRSENKPIYIHCANGIQVKIDVGKDGTVQLTCEVYMLQIERIRSIAHIYIKWEALVITLAPNLIQATTDFHTTLMKLKTCLIANNTHIFGSMHQKITQGC